MSIAQLAIETPALIFFERGFKKSETRTVSTVIHETIHIVQRGRQLPHESLGAGSLKYTIRSAPFPVDNAPLHAGSWTAYILNDDPYYSGPPPL